MTTMRQLLQTSPVKANELFARLVDTSDSAVKTRDRLFGELKEELELIAKLEEQYLFPVLKRHKGTKELVLAALTDNRQTRKLLAELERMPKDGEHFGSKVVELRKVFQQHVRDEKNELLPAILKALSDEETGAVVDQIEDAKVQIESDRRREAEERRSEARREREHNEAAQHAEEELGGAVRAGFETVQKAAFGAQASVQNGSHRAVEEAARSTDQLTQEVTGHTGLAMENFRAVATTLAQGFQDVSRQWLKLSQSRYRKNLAGVTALGQCRSLQDLVAVQSTLIRDNMEMILQNGAELAQLSVDVVARAAKSMSEQPLSDTAQPRRAA